jgi:lipopolysaccharide transport system ATP-binding protein
MSEPILTVDNLGKRFKLYHRKQDRIVEWLTLGKRQTHQDFWAVRNINFELQRGDFLGVLGHNGAGKSTLLKMLSGVLVPSEGDFHINGRLLSLLELGTGTNPALSGRENIYNRAKIYGFDPVEVDDRIEQIKDFSELGDFFEYPVSTYSSGMRSRLNFSAFAFLDCDLLILDEVLAVGDIFFKQKCYNRMDELIRANTTIILVTHSVQYVNNFCNKTLVINAGEQAYWGEKEEGVRLYGRMRHKSLRTLTPQSLPDEAKQKQHIERVQRKLVQNNWQGETIDWPDPDLFPTIAPIRKRNLVLEQFLMLNEGGEPTTVFEQGETATIYYTFQVVREAIEGKPAGSLLLFDSLNNLIHAKDNYQHDAGKELPLTLEPGSFIRFKQQITMNLQAKQYILKVRVLQIREEDDAREVIFSAEQASTFDVIVPIKNVLFAPFEGFVDLPGSSQVQWKTD